MSDRKPIVIAAGDPQNLQSSDRLVDGYGVPIRHESSPFYLSYTFSTTTTDSDPGNGALRLDNATQNTATTIRVDLLDSAGISTEPFLNIATAFSSPGKIRLLKASDPTRWIEFSQTGVDLSPPSGYRNLQVAVKAFSHANPFSNGDALLFYFTPQWVTTLSNNVDLAGIISPSQITSDQNNYAPTDFSICSTVRLTSDVANRAITGLAGGTPGKVILLHNIGSALILLSHNSGSSSSGNRFKVVGARDFRLAADGIAVLQYDLTSVCWRVVAGSNINPFETNVDLIGVITPTITGNVDNYAPTGFSTCSTVRITSTGGTWNITGLAGGSDGKIILLHNIGALNIVLKHASGSSTSTNRFTLPLATDALLAPDMIFLLNYDNTAQRWRVMGSSNFSALNAVSLAIAANASDALALTTSQNTTFGRPASILAASLSSGNDVQMALGRSLSDSDVAYWMFLKTASLGTNCMAWGFWNHDKLLRLFPSGGLFLGNSSPADPGTSALQIEGKFIAGAAIRSKGFAVGSLPAGTLGDRAHVTDALAPTFGATVAAGGSVKVPVFYDGSNWIVG